MPKYIAALDAGTTSSRAIIFDKGCNIVEVSQQEFRQIFPQPGWVEHDAVEIWDTQLHVLRAAIEKSGAADGDIAAIGVTNQRETTIVWDKASGEPIYNAIVWQCRRTSDAIEKLRADGLADYVKKTTGLIADPYFSGSKIAWILDNVPGARARAEAGELLFGTVDTWLIWKLTGGRVHVTDYTNASRTMIYDIHNKCWDEKLLEYFGIPASMLPKVVCSSEIVGYTDAALLGMEIPISGIAGDQQSALFGQGCVSAGDAKNTYGTGCFALMNTGDKAVESSNGLLTTLACGHKGEPVYALEGSVFIAGAAIQWLRDMMRIVDTAPESEKACNAVTDTGGVYIVPAFSGLGAPYWNPQARGTVVGITRGTSREHFIRATVESMAYQVYDLIKAMEADCGHELSSLKVDGGACANNFLMQFQSDILRKCVVRPSVVETTAQGAAYLAGLAVGYWSDIDEAMRCRAIDRTFAPSMDEGKADELLKGWSRAIKAAVSWTE